MRLDQKSGFARSNVIRPRRNFWSSRTDRQSYALTRCSKKKIVKIIYQGDKIRIFLLLFQWQVKLGVKQCYDGIVSYSGGAIAAQDTWKMIMLWWNPMQLMNFHLGLNRGNSCFCDGRNISFHLCATRHYVATRLGDAWSCGSRLYVESHRPWFMC